MGSKSVRKRCRDCRTMRAGTPGRMEWCDTCGGELVVLAFRGSKRKSRRAR